MTIAASWSRLLAILLRKKLPPEPVLTEVVDIATLADSPEPAEPPPVPPVVAASVACVVMRQSVFNRQMQLAGYVFAAADAGAAGDLVEHDRAVIAYAAAPEAQALLGGASAFVAVSTAMLGDPLIKTLRQPASIPLLHFPAELGDIDYLIGVIAALRQHGVAPALADGRLALAYPALAEAACVAFFPVADYAPPDLLQLAHQLRKNHPMLQLGATGLKSHEEFDVCRRLGFKYFQGDFLTQQEDWSANQADPSFVGIARLLDSLRQGGAVAEIAEQIKLDPLLSYRILRFANSAALAPDQEITSVKDAALLIGQDFLYRWLVLAMCAMGPAGEGQQALLETALQRGRLMELLAGSAVDPVAPETCFMAGMFSLLDIMLKVSMDSLLASLSLPAVARAAIVERSGPCAPLLQLAEACEKGDAEQIVDLCFLLGIDAATLNQQQLAAGQWARDTVSQLQA